MHTEFLNNRKKRKINRIIAYIHRRPAQTITLYYFSKEIRKCS